MAWELICLLIYMAYCNSDFICNDTFVHVIVIIISSSSRCSNSSSSSSSSSSILIFFQI